MLRHLMLQDTLWQMKQWAGCRSALLLGPGMPQQLLLLLLIELLLLLLLLLLIALLLLLLLLLCCKALLLRLLALHGS
jgi:hypothetical protein